MDARLATTFRTAMAILGNEADARDATQEIFLRAWRNLPSSCANRTASGRGSAAVVNTWVGPRSGGRRRRIVRESVGALLDEGVPVGVAGESA